MTDFTSYIALTKPEIVKKWVSEHPTPDLQYCPHLIITSQGNNHKYGGRYTKCYIPVTGEVYIDQAREEEPERNYYAGRGNHNWFAYIRNVPELNMLELGMVTIGGKMPDRSKFVDKRDFSFHCQDKEETFKNSMFTRHYLFKGDIQPYNVDGSLFAEEKTCKFYNKTIISALRAYSKYYNIKLASKELSKFLYGSDIAPEGKIEIYGPWDWAKAYEKHVDRPEKKSSKEKNPILAVELTPVKEIAAKCPIYYNAGSGKGYIVKSGGYYEKLTDDWSVIRCFSRSFDTATKDALASASVMSKNLDIVGTCEDPEELQRVYIGPKNKIEVYRKDGAGDYERVSKPLDYYYYDRTYHAGYTNNIILYNPEDMIKDGLVTEKFCEDLIKKYSSGSYRANSGKIWLDDIIARLRAVRLHPIYGLLLNSGVDNLAKIIDEDHVESSIRNIFKTEKISNTDIIKTTGFNMYQLKEIDSISGLYTSWDKKKLIGYLKFGITDISALDNDVFDAILTNISTAMKTNRDVCTYSEVLTRPGRHDELRRAVVYLLSIPGLCTDIIKANQVVKLLASVRSKVGWAGGSADEIDMAKVIMTVDPVNVLSSIDAAIKSIS